jgi:23S rRNA (uridine2552-2'-O)-methyltransferase
MRGPSVRLATARGRSGSSQRWLTRQLNDPYVAEAKAKGFRSRSAFKLLELDARFHLLGRGKRVVDLGAAPGGWSQVALERGAVAVVGVDLLAIDPLPGANFVQGDFTDSAMPARLAALIGGKADVVLSDMAPNTTGHAATDHLRILALAELALAFAAEVLAPGGAFVCKLFQGGAERGLLTAMQVRFAKVRHAKPPASRKESSELYAVATGFR